MINAKSLCQDIEINVDITPIPIQILLTTGDKLNLVASGGNHGIIDDGDMLIIYPAHVEGNSMDAYTIRKSHIVYTRYFPVSEEDSELKYGVTEHAYNYPWKRENDK